MKRLTEALKKANAQAEHFERSFYLQKDSNEQLVMALEDISVWIEKYKTKPNDPLAIYARAILAKHKEQA